MLIGLDEGRKISKRVCGFAWPSVPAMDRRRMLTGLDHDRLYPASELWHRGTNAGCDKGIAEGRAISACATIPAVGLWAGLTVCRGGNFGS